MKNNLNVLEKIVLIPIPFIIIILLWHFITISKIWPSYFFPTLEQTMDALYQGITSGELWLHWKASLIRLLLATAISILTAPPLAIIMAINRKVANYFDPLLNFFQSIAGIAWIPMALIWFGFGIVSMLFVLVNTIFFPIIFNTFCGVRDIPKVLKESPLTLGANKLNIVLEVLIPGALPNIFTGLRIGVGYGWRALIAAEMISANTGVGFLIFDSRMYFETDVVISTMILIGITWLVMDHLMLKPMERFTVEKWKIEKN